MSFSGGTKTTSGDTASSGGSLTGLTPNGVVYATGMTSVTTTPVGTAGYVLTSTGTGAPTWQVNAPSFSGLTQFRVAFASSTSSITTPITNGTANYVLISNGGSMYPSFGDISTLPAITSINSSITTINTEIAALANNTNQTANTVYAGPSSGMPALPTFRSLVAADIPLIPLSSGVTGTLQVMNGGTGLSSLTAGQFLYALSSYSIGTSPNIVIQSNGNLTVTSNTGNGAEISILPASATYAGFFAASNAASAASLLMGIDGVGLSNTHAGQALIRFNGTATSLWFENASGTDIMSLTSTGTLSPTTLQPTNALGTAYGGTGNNAAIVQGGIAYGSSTSQISTSAAGTSGYVLVSGGTGAPTWAASAPAGFTGLVQYAPLYASSTTTATTIASLGTSGQALISQGSSAPVYGALGLGSSSNVSGTLAIANGGTGLTSTSQNFVFAGPTSGSGAPSWRLLVGGDIPTISLTTGDFCLD